MIAKTKIEIKKLFNYDIPDILNIEQECFSTPWNKKTFYETLKNKNTYFLKATYLNEIVGYIGIYFVQNEGYIYNIAVKKSYRNLGIGSMLLKKILCVCHKEYKLKFLSLEVRKSNLAAIKLYEKFGFITLGYRKNFYRKPIEDAIIMTIFF